MAAQRNAGRWAIGAATCILLSNGALAQVYKCTDAAGKITYTDRACEAAVNVRRVTVNPNVIETPEVRNALAARQRAAATSPAVSTAAPQAVATDMPYTLTTSDAQRIRELQMVIDSGTVTPERRRAAREEIDRIHRGVAARMSPEDQRRAAELQRDLASIDDQKRRQAERNLRTLTDRYESPEFRDRRAQAEAERRQRELADAAAAAAASAAAAAARANAAAAQAAASGRR